MDDEALDEAVAEWSSEPVTKPDVVLSMAEVAALYSMQWEMQRAALEQEAA